MNKPTNIPDWDLGSIYPDINSEKYKSDLAKLTEGIKTLKALNDQAENPDQKNHLNIQNWIADFFKADDILGPLANTLAAYSYSIYSVDTTSKSLLDNLNQVESLTDQYEIQLNRFSHTVAKNRGILSEFYVNFPQYKKYEFSINEMLEDDIHTLSPELEGIIAKLQQTGGRAWDRLHEQLISNLKDPETGKLFNELRNDAYSPDARLRKESWQKEIALLKQNEIAFAASLNNLKGETLSLLEERSWNCAIDRALSSSRMKKETLDALIAAIEESLPQWRKYLKAKAEYLKNHNATASTNCGKEKGLAFYDLFAPLDGNTTSDGNTNTAGQTETGCNTNTSDSTNNRAASEESLLSKNWTFDEARDYIIREFASFSPKMGEFAQNAFDRNWIDARVHPGKVGGAYCQDFYVQKESRVLSNFTGAFSDIITLAHELGHAFHFFCIKDKDYRNANYPMTLAETASTFAETILKQDILKTASKEDRIKILELDLQDTCQVLVDILCRFYFERSVFEERQNGELTSEDFCRLMAHAQERSYGDGLSAERHEYMWAVKSHYYSVDLDFYNFPYAFGQLFAAGLYSRYKKEGKAFVDIYCNLLSDTGSMSCEDLCFKAGFDITKKDFWKSGIDFYINEIEQFCKEAE
ncbi:MAG: M3 family oligoendopeptidase [Treponema sp.]|uniref:M3 family oligoendopeptidase n=1 Tax=Treponema sp. TaxID=166 RepID=UPI001DDD4FF2|nr:M3 family oligoendopeptidase [Treponema sp.]MBS7310418.1 M3 family oligoendopeptidase [Treponema sp.]